MYIKKVRPPGACKKGTVAFTRQPLSLQKFCHQKFRRFENSVFNEALQAVTVSFLQHDTARSFPPLP